jgi:transcriptional/translational regulatory protein YebC/TACO1
MEAALEAGADDVVTEGDHVVVYTAQNDFHRVKEALDAAGLESVAAELTMIPSNTVVLNSDSASKILKLQEKLEDHDDIQAVHANFEIPDEVLATIQEA